MHWRFGWCVVDFAVHNIEFLAELSFVSLQRVTMLSATNNIPGISQWLGLFIPSKPPSKVWVISPRLTVLVSMQFVRTLTAN
jgi:hypothetical protein